MSSVIRDMRIAQNVGLELMSSIDGCLWIVEFSVIEGIGDLDQRLWNGRSGITIDILWFC